ncbi:MAG: ABC transporter substrate-binding protein [Oscillospiraceae bacterium]|nr:ABC transporter substrate-binding protein [Oscillospiraceae bacterium]
MKKWLSIALLFVMMASILTACGEAPAAPSGDGSNVEDVDVTDQTIEAGAVQADEVNVGIPRNLESLSPFAVSGMAGGYVVDTMYETLGGYYGFGGEFKGMAMKSFELDDTGYIWHIELYDNIYDTEGNHITASDIKFFYDEGKARANANMNYIDSIDIKDDYNFDMVMNVSEAGRFERICTGWYIFSEAAFKASPDEMASDPVGTTPYRLTNYVSGSSLTFEATGNYWNDPANSLYGYDNVKKIVFHVIPEAAQMSNSLETGTIDIAQSLTLTEVNRLQAAGFDTIATDAHLCYMLFFNCDADEGYFADKPELRKAIVYAINREDIIEVVASGAGTELKNIGSSNYGDYSPAAVEGDYYAYDPAKAAELVEKSGYDGSVLKLVVSNNEIHQNAAVCIKADLEAVGIKVDIDAQENNIYDQSKADPTQFDLILENKGDQAYMIGLIRNSFDLNNFKKSGKPNDTFIIDQTLQDLIVKASSEAGHTDANVKAAADYIAEQCYGVGLFVLKNFYAYNPAKISKVVLCQWDGIVPGCCTYLAS